MEEYNENSALIGWIECQYINNMFLSVEQSRKYKHLIKNIQSYNGDEDVINYIKKTYQIYF